jgi:hypothetical protein
MRRDRKEFMPDEQRCEFPGCEETIVQPECGGTPRRYCSHDHRVAARRLRSVTRVETDPTPARAAHRGSGVEAGSRPLPVWITDPFAVPEGSRPADHLVDR